MELTAAGRRQTPLEACTEHPEDPLKHIHEDDGRYVPVCSWHPGEFHWICSEAAG